MIENVSMEAWIGFIVFVGGLILLAGAIWKKQLGWNIPQPAAMVFGIILAVFGGLYSIPQMLDAFAVDDDTDDTGGTTVVVEQSGATDYVPTFRLDVTNGTTGLGNTTTVQINDAETMATVLLETAGTGGNQPLCGTHFAVNFTVDPVPPTGANADTLATVYFETDYTMQYQSEDILAKSGNIYYANWTYAGGTSDEASADYSGDMTMLMTETGYAEITYEMDSGSADVFSAELDTIGDTGTWDITFHNSDWTWSEVFTVTWILVEQ